MRDVLRLNKSDQKDFHSRKKTIRVLCPFASISRACVYPAPPMGPVTNASKGRSIVNMKKTREHVVQVKIKNCIGYHVLLLIRHIWTCSPHTVRHPLHIVYSKDLDG